MKKLMIISMIFMASCNSDRFDIATTYTAFVHNYSQNNLIVEYKTRNGIIEHVTIKPYNTVEPTLSFSVNIFSAKIEANQPPLNSQDFRNHIPLLNIYRLTGNDTVLVNPDSNQ